MRRELDIGMLVPAPDSKEGSPQFYRVDGKLVTGKGMVSYWLVPAIKGTDLEPVRFDRGTAPRPGEIDGVDYFFVSNERFDQMIQEGAFLEWAEFAGNRYGTPREPVDQWLSLGKHVLLEIEIAGARQVRAAAPDALLLFIAPPSWDELVSRLTSRGTDTPERRAARLALAEEEMACAGEFDQTLINHTVEGVAQSLLSLASAHQAGSSLN